MCRGRAAPGVPMQRPQHHRPKPKLLPPLLAAILTPLASSSGGPLPGWRMSAETIHTNSGPGQKGDGLLSRPFARLWKAFPKLPSGSSSPLIGHLPYKLSLIEMLGLWRRPAPPSNTVLPISEQNQSSVREERGGRRGDW